MADIPIGMRRQFTACGACGLLPLIAACGPESPRVEGLRVLRAFFRAFFLRVVAVFPSGLFSGPHAAAADVLADTNADAA